MAEVLSQDEINQLLEAIGLDDKKKSGKKTSPEEKRILAQNEIEKLLTLISADYKNKTVIGKLLYNLKTETANPSKPPADSQNDGELSPEEIAMLLKAHPGIEKSR